MLASRFCLLLFRIPVAIDRHEILVVQTDRRAVRAGKARPFSIDRGMHIHGTLQAENFDEI